jgi:hypothetical protein
MFDELLNQITALEVSDTDLQQVISKDVNGDDVTVGELLDAKAPPAILSSFGRAPAAPQRAKIKSVHELNEQEVKDVVNENLNSIPAGEALAVAGYGSFTIGQLRDEVNNQTEIGRRYAEIVTQHNAFVERAVEMGKIRSKSGGAIKIPNFDF